MNAHHSTCPGLTHASSLACHMLLFCSRADAAGCNAGVIAAAALKCMGGTMQGRLWPRSDEERQKAEEAGYDISKV